MTCVNINLFNSALEKLGISSVQLSYPHKTQHKESKCNWDHEWQSRCYHTSFFINPLSEVFLTLK